MLQTTAESIVMATVEEALELFLAKDVLKVSAGALAMTVGGILECRVEPFEHYEMARISQRLAIPWDGNWLLLEASDGTTPEDIRP